VSYIFRKLFSETTFPSHILEPFKSYTASVLTMVEKFDIFRLVGDAPGEGALPPHAIHFIERSHRADVKL